MNRRDAAPAVPAAPPDASAPPAPPGDAVGPPTPLDEGPPRRRWSFLTSPSWIAIILVAIAFAGACFWILGPWQFGRNSERSAQNDAISAAMGRPAVPAGDLMSVDRDPASDAVWRLVTATGEFVPDHQAFARLRQNDEGEPVSHVVVPLRLSDGSWLLVDRGYVSFGSIRRGEALPELPAGQVTVTGRVRLTETDPLNRVPVQMEGRTEIYAIDPRIVGGAGSPMGELAGAPVRGFVQLEDGSAGVLSPVGVPQVDAGPFLSYALQWLAFGAIALIGVGVFVYREATGSREKEPLPYDKPYDDPHDDPDAY